MTVDLERDIKYAMLFVIYKATSNDFDQVFTLPSQNIIIKFVFDCVINDALSSKHLQILSALLSRVHISLYVLITSYSCWPKPFTTIYYLYFIPVILVIIANGLLYPITIYKKSCGRTTIRSNLRVNKWRGVLGSVGLLLAKLYNFWQVCSFVGLLLAKIYNFGKYVRLSVCLFVCPFCQA